MVLESPACNIRLIDSHNFLPMALLNYKKCLAYLNLQWVTIHTFSKGKPTNEARASLENEFYNHNVMKVGDRERFVERYNIRPKVVFDFQQEIPKYCRSDLNILKKCCLKFRTLFMDITSGGTGGIDPFGNCNTIASACNLVFRNKYLECETIGIISD